MTNFLNLPIEIRLEIYQYLFACNGTSLLLWIDEQEIRKLNGKTTYIPSYRFSETPPDRNVLLSCWQCYGEAINVHHAALTHLSIEFVKLQQAYPANCLERPEQRRYEDYIADALHRLYFSSHHRTLLHQIQKLTIPAFVSLDTLLGCLQLTLLPAIKIIEFIAQDGQIRDLSVPYDNSLFSAFRPPHTVPSTARASPTPPFQEYFAYEFDPWLHLQRSMFFYINPFNVLLQDAVITQIMPKIQILWTTEVEWSLSCGNFGLSSNDIGYPIGRGEAEKQCLMVRFMYTYDCSAET